MNREDKISLLCKAVMNEVQKTYGDYMDPSWNSKAHAEITLTVEEARLAHSIYYGCKYNPSKKGKE